MQSDTKQSQITPNKAIIISAPSGSGKTTLVHHLLNSKPDLTFSISATTRMKRTQQEQHGKDYYFLTQEEFKQKIDAGDFAEWEEVYPGKYYGTLKSEIQRIWQTGKQIIFDIDVKGGINLKKYFGKTALSIFIKAGPEDALKQRLTHRATENSHDLSERLSKVGLELKSQHQFDTILINDNLEQAKKDLTTLYDNFTAQ